MSRRWLFLLASATMLFVAASGRVAAAATTEEVLAKIVKAEDELKSLEGDMKGTVKIPGQEREIAFHFAAEFVAKDGKPAVRRTYSKMEIKQGDGKGMKQLRVFDGEFQWTEHTTPGGELDPVVKSQPGTPRSEEAGMARMARSQFDLALAAEDTLDGEKVWVLEGPLNEKEKARGGNNPPAKCRMLVSQNDCMARRMLLYDKDGKELVDAQFSNVKANQPIDPALFKYTPPEGAHVIDNTRPAAPKDADKPENDSKKVEPGDK